MPFNTENKSTSGGSPQFLNGFSGLLSDPVDFQLKLYDKKV